MTVPITSSFASYNGIHVGDTVKFTDVRRVLYGIVIVENKRMKVQVIRCFYAPEFYLFKTFNIDDIKNVTFIHRNSVTREF